MKLGLRVAAVFIGWYALHDVLGLVRAIHAGIDESYAGMYIFTALISVVLQVSAAILMIFKSEAVLSLLGVDDRSVRAYGSPYLAGALAVILALYMFIEGATFSITAYASAKMELADSNYPYGNFFTTNLFDWGWEDAVFGLIQALISLIVLIGMLSYNKKISSAAANAQVE